MASPKGFLAGLMDRILFRHGTVTRVEPLGAHFTRIDVAGPELEGIELTPGDKVQLFVSGELRTYTPVKWSASEGTTWFLGYRHGTGTPAATWLSTVKTGDPLALFGPRASVNVTAEAGPLVVAGDETSLALTASLAAHRSDVSAVLEGGDPEDLASVGRALQVPALTAVPRGDVAAMTAALRTHLEAGAFVIFTGNAKTIQALQKSLPRHRAKTRAYWAPGKRGLD